MNIQILSPSASSSVYQTLAYQETSVLCHHRCFQEARGFVVPSSCRHATTDDCMDTHCSLSHRWSISRNRLTDWPFPCIFVRQPISIGEHVLPFHLCALTVFVCPTRLTQNRYRLTDQSFWFICVRQPISIGDTRFTLNSHCRSDSTAVVEQRSSDSKTTRSIQ